MAFESDADAVDEEIEELAAIKIAGTPRIMHTRRDFSLKC
jgi:hypothetical protein